MNTLPLSFSFNSAANVRIVLVDNEPWFVARDIADALGYTNTKKAVLDHCKRAKPLSDIGVTNRYPEQNQELDLQTKLIPEPDVYRLIVRSKLPAAEAFETWLFEEVLPSIRKTGGYQVGQVPALSDYERISKAQLDELTTAVSRAFGAWVFQVEGPMHGHNDLRVRFSLRTLADLPAAEFELAKDIVKYYAQAADAFLFGIYDARKEFYRVISDNAPWTPSVLRKLPAEAIKALPARPDWLAIQQQLALDGPLAP